MAKDPAFLFYHHDFLVGVTFMTMEERGAYITLLCFLADKGKITLQEILKIISPKVWESIKSKFKEKDGFFYNERLRFEVEKRKNFSKSRSINKLGKKHMNNICESSDSHMENENENRNKNRNKDVLERVQRKPFGESKTVMLTEDEYSKLVQRFGPTATEVKIGRLENYMFSAGKKYKSHYHTILSWAQRDGVKSGDRKIRGMADLQETARQIEQELRS